MRGVAFKDAHDTCAHKRYWMTCDEYDAMVREQGKCCKICLDATAPLVIDHDHALGIWAVRGAICQLCNTLLAQVDSGRWQATEAVAHYLASPWHADNGPRTKPQPVTPPRPEKKLRKRSYKGTAIHAFRVDDELWEAAQRKAAVRRTTVTWVLKQALLAFVAEEGREAE